jgi:hypothetical protein
MTDDERRAHLDRLLHGTVCFDATVPLYIADAGYVHTLTAAFRDRAVIPGGVYKELDGLSYGTHSEASKLLKPKPFARVIALTDDELARVLNRRRRWNGNRAFEYPLEDRGEAECLELCLRNPAEFMALCAHDHKAVNDARTENIRLFHAADVCLVFAIQGMPDEAAWDLYVELVTVHGMRPIGLFPPNPSGRAAFETLLFNSRRVLAPAATS